MRRSTRSGRRLHDALHAYAETQKKDFLAAQGGEHSANAGEYKLDITFTVARRTDDFVSVLVSGSSFTGGAHPNPLTASFVAYPAENRMVAMGDLFTDAGAALKILSDEARAQLQGRFEAQLREQIGEGDKLEPALKDMREWVERGTEPKAEKFRGVSRRRARFESDRTHAGVSAVSGRAVCRRRTAGGSAGASVPFAAETRIRRRVPLGYRSRKERGQH